MYIYINRKYKITLSGIILIKYDDILKYSYNLTKVRAYNLYKLTRIVE